MKKIFVLVALLLYFFPSFASHIAGGELYYEYLGTGSVANTSKYKLTMRLFRDCNSTGQTLEAESVVIGVYSTNSLLLYTKVPLVRDPVINVISFNNAQIPCLVSAPTVCYQIGIFTGEVELPSSTLDGFTLSWIRCCRIDNIGNMSGTTGIGATYVTKIPGLTSLPSGNNSSPQFAVKDAQLVCQNKQFSLDFGATDPDGDQLVYSFCDGYLGGSTVNPNPGPTSTLYLSPLPYIPPFNGQNPLGTSVSINSSTGKITGIAPSAGRYVINVCVTEKRNGVAINEHRKDFILQVGNCDFAEAIPAPLAGAYCKDFKVNFSNNSTSSSIQSYFWNFGVPGSSTNTSSQPQPVFTYPQAGNYTITLTVKGMGGCEATGTTTLGVYPGFTPDFDITGSCFQTPFTFKDKSTANYGVVNSWTWDFGDLSTAQDVSSLQNPTYKYADTGTRNVSLTVTSSMGCKDVITKSVKITNKPSLMLSFKDTLICSIDTLQLIALGTGNFSWTPAYNISNANTANPLVYPKNTTSYIVMLSDNSCVATDTIKVNVLNAITVNAGADTTICSTDTFMLRPVSDGTIYNWTPAGQIMGNANIKNATAKPLNTTTYIVTANLGKCVAKDDINVKVVPYPKANAGADAAICYGKQTQLSGIITGSTFTWTPVNSLVNANTLTPTAEPTTTTAYILKVYDTLGCPKPSVDTIVVSVIPHINAFAGNDTSIVANQPLQLNASGGTFYAWTPATGMNNSFVANPIVTLSASYDSITYKVRVSVIEGCYEDDEVKVKVFKTGPDIFVPSAFTPNHDGRNDYLKPIPVGMRSVESFKVFNRWGQVVYNSVDVTVGWDGTFGGKDQASGTYVFLAGGTDYLGKHIFKKGTVVLVR